MDCRSENETPAKEQANPADGHARPLPKIECVGMLNDSAILENKSSVDDIMHRSAVWPKKIFCLPMGCAGFIVCMNIAECDFQFLCAPAKHLPHGEDFFACKHAEGRVAKNNIRGITRVHAGGVAGMKGFIEFLDCLFVWMQVDSSI